MLVALGTNLVIAGAKIFGGLIGSSSALLSEGAHSIADSLNEVLLFVALRRSGRPPDRNHPFGYGKERFFYSLMAGVGIFVAGGGYSIFEGILALTHPHQSHVSYTLKYVILGASFVLEAMSWLRAVHQLRDEARAKGRSVLGHLATTSDPTVKTVATEDSAALIGLALAFGGIALHQATGRPVFDAVASLAIGALLIAVAAFLVRDNKEFLIGQAAEPEVRDGIMTLLGSCPEVTSVVEIMTEVLGPTELLVLARLDFEDSLTGAQIEDASTRMAQELRRAFPEVTQVFLDATRAPSDLD